MDAYKRQSAKRTTENSPAIHRWDQVCTSNPSPRSGRLNPLSCAITLPASVVRYADSQSISQSVPSTEVLGYSHPSASQTNETQSAWSVISSLYRCSLLVSVLLACASICFSQGKPEVQKVEPPSWWAGSSLNPVRLLIRGSNLKGARLQVVGRGVRIIGSPKTNERGTYLFVDVAVEPRALPGPRQLRITTAGGFADAWFEVLLPLNRSRRFQGFSPADVMY